VRNQMSDYQIFEATNFQLQRGVVLPKARLAYKTVGTLNAARDNAVLVPTWFMGTHQDTETYMVGPDRALDPTKYFIILPNLLGNGISSSPSNTPAPFDRGRFPLVTINDNVRLQQAMILSELGIERLRLVAGWSMGAAQAFEWTVQFPSMVRGACAIAGSSRTSNYNKLFLLSLRRALELDPIFNEGFYDRPPVRGLRAFATIYAGWGTSEPFFRTEMFRSFGSLDWKEHLADFWEPFFLRFDANDILSHIATWSESNISANSTFNGNFDAALRSIQARMIVVPIDLDRYFPPVDSLYEASRIRKGECRVVRSDWGHLAPMNPADLPVIDGALGELLSEEA
jgi:homoserine O-acetyltransferase/O-succinyltransferase